MALKRQFTEHERFGLTEEETNLGEAYLRKHKTAGQIPKDKAMLLYELFMVGTMFRELAQQFPQFELGQIILTAALQGWAHDRDKIICTIRERVQTTVMRSILEQVDFLTTMMSVTNTEHLSAMRAYLRDPENNPKPNFKIESLKDYNSVLESLQKLLNGANATKVKNGMSLFDVAESKKPPPKVLPANNGGAPNNTKLLEAILVDEDDDEQQ